MYQYDALGALVSGTVAPSQTQSVTYDAFGNIKIMTTAGIPISFGVDPGTNRIDRMDRMSDPGVTFGAYASYDTARTAPLCPQTLPSNKGMWIDMRSCSCEPDPPPLRQTKQ